MGKSKFLSAQLWEAGGRAGGADGRRRARAVGGRVLQLTGESRVGGTSPVPSFLCSVALPTGVPVCGSLRLTWAGDVNGEVKYKTSQPRGSGGQRSPLPPAGKAPARQTPAVLTRVECGPLGSSTKGTQVCPGVSTGTEHIECASLALASVSGDAQCSSLHLGSRLPERTSAGSVASRSLEDTAV